MRRPSPTRRTLSKEPRFWAIRSRVPAGRSRLEWEDGQLEKAAVEPRRARRVGACLAPGRDLFERLGAPDVHRDPVGGERQRLAVPGQLEVVALGIRFE